MLEVNSKKTKIMTFQKRGKDVIDLVHESGFRRTFLSALNSMAFSMTFSNFP